jgi:hypothetical protein
MKWAITDNESSKGDTATSLLEFLLQTKTLSITEGEIQDRSKGDTISKTIAVWQTTWFITQCIARGVEGLAVTNLEIMTCAFAALNVLTYRFWWNKPKDVQYPIRIDISKTREGFRNEVGIIRNTKSVWKVLFESLKTDFNTVGENFLFFVPFSLLHLVHPAVYRNFFFFYISLYLFLPYYPLFTLTMHCGRILPDFAKNFHALFIGFGITTAFGGIHCIPLSFSFPTHAEQILWQSCALVLTLSPVLGMIYVLEVRWAENILNRRVVIFITRNILVMVASSLLGLYILARVILIILALTELRALSSTTYQTVLWTTLIPHI